MKIIKKISEELSFVTPSMKKTDDYVLQVDEEDITSVSMLKSVSYWSLNYAEKKDCFQYLGKDFSNLIDEDKKEIVYLCAVDVSTCLNYYINDLGLTQEQAQEAYTNNRAEDIINLSNVCKDNIKKSSLLKILLKYMPQSSAETFLNETLQLTFNYGEYAVYGKKYGNNINGILDYVEQYGDYATTGLGSIVLYDSNKLPDLKSELVSLLTNNRSNLI